MSTRTEVFRQALRRLGGFSGSITSGDQTSAVLGGMVNTTGDDSAYIGWTLWFPDADTEADQAREVTDWDDSEGQAQWVTDRTDTSYEDETYFLVPPKHGSLTLWRNLLNDRLADTRRTVWNVVPTVEDERFYSLSRFTWIRNRGDVVAAFYRVSPNLLDNSEFGLWGDGPSSAPTGWTATNATVARNSHADNPDRVSHGRYSVSLTGDGAAGQLDFDLDPRLVYQLRGLNVTAKVDCLSSGAAALYIVDDGGSDSDSHSGGGTRETLSVTRTIDASATRVRVRLESPDSVTSHFDHAIAEEGDSVQDLLREAGDDAWRRVPLAYEVLDHGGDTVIELPAPKARRAQILVVSKMPYPALSGDSDETDCPDDVIVPGLIYELARTLPPGESRDRWDRLMAQYGREYAFRASRLLQVPVPAPRTPVVVRGA